MFDIQLFADTTTSETVLQIKNVFADDDTRTIDLKDPRDDITAADIKDLENYIVENNLLIGDKEGAAFAYIESAINIETERVRIDIAGL